MAKPLDKPLTPLRAPGQPGPKPSSPPPAPAAKPRAADPAGAAISPETWAVLALLAAGAIMSLTAALAGSAPVALVAAVVFACAAQGLWRGAAEIAGLLIGTLVALLLAPPLGRALEGVFSSALGATGVQNRLLSVAITFAGILIIVTVGAGFGASRLLKTRPQWARWNRWAGGALGLFEGGLLAMAVLWVPLAMEPVAQARVAADREAAEAEGGTAKPNAAAAGVVAFAKAVRQSPLGGLAEATNPVQGSLILSMAEDYATISRDREALAAFVNSPVMQRIKELPSVKSAIERLKADPKLKEMFSTSSAVSPGTLLDIMKSQAVLDVLDGGTVVSDLTPLVGEIAEAMKAAKEKAKAANPQDEPGGP